MRSIILAGLMAATTASAAFAAETRCGWLENPTPGNWWLDDRDASWTIMAQGADDAAEGMDNIPDISASDQYVASNGNYGYTCACLSVDVDAEQKRITDIYSYRQLSISKCENDPAVTRDM